MSECRGVSTASCTPCPVPCTVQKQCTPTAPQPHPNRTPTAPQPHIVNVKVDPVGHRTPQPRLPELGQRRWRARPLPLLLLPLLLLPMLLLPMLLLHLNAFRCCCRACGRGTGAGWACR